MRSESASSHARRRTSGDVVTGKITIPLPGLLRLRRFTPGETSGVSCVASTADSTRRQARHRIFASTGAPASTWYTSPQLHRKVAISGS